MPLYGAGLRPDGTRASFGDDTDTLHCADATAITAAAIRELARRGDAGPRVGPFATERASFLALHEELSACARRAFEEQTRLHRDPRTWSARELADGLRDPAKFIEQNRIGYPSRTISPERRLSWWFNTAMLQYGWLEEAGAAIPVLRTGRIQPPQCQGERAAR